MNVSMGQLARDVYAGGTILTTAISHRLTSAPESRVQTIPDGPGTILIVGGELFNKGAQAMTYTVVSQLAERFPEKDVVLMSTRDFERPAGERNRYTFEILPWDPDIRLSYLRGGSPLRRNAAYSASTLKRVDEVIDDAECIIDINGYALSSQRGTRRSLLYLLNIIIARRRDIPFHIFPQSLGPFEFGFPQSLPLEFLLKTYLPYPAWVFPREQSGVDTVTRYRDENVRHELDLVLTHDYDLDHVFHDPPVVDVPELPDGSVGIVPNMQVAKRMSEAEFEDLYRELIDELREFDRHPVVIQHAVEDEPLCETIGEIAGEDATVLTGDRQPFELEEIIEQLDFLVGSRYHSVVHAYKRAVPAIVIGWAEKYRALVGEFGQSDSVFDVRSDTETKPIPKAIELQCSEYTSRSAAIHDHLDDFTAEKSVFDEI